MLSVEACASPQDSPDLLLLLRLLALGQGAWDMIDSQVFKEPKMVTVLGCDCVCDLCERVCGAEEDEQGGALGGRMEDQAFRSPSRRP